MRYRWMGAAYQAVRKVGGLRSRIKIVKYEVRSIDGSASLTFPPLSMDLFFSIDNKGVVCEKKDPLEIK
jgi:hypothetical protein